MKNKIRPDVMQNIIELAYVIDFLIFAAIFCCVIWLLVESMPVGWYFMGTACIYLLLKAVPDRFNIAKAAQSVAASVSVGFFILMMVKVYFFYTSESVNEASVYQVSSVNTSQLANLENFELGMAEWYEKLEFYGKYCWYILSISLLLLVFCRYKIRVSIWMEKISSFKKSIELLVAGMAVATSFSFVAVDEVLGVLAKDQIRNIEFCLHYSKLKEKVANLKTIRIHAQAAVLHSLSTKKLNEIFLLANRVASIRALDSSHKREALFFALNLDQFNLVKEEIGSSENLNFLAYKNIPFDKKVLSKISKTQYENEVRSETEEKKAEDSYVNEIKKAVQGVIEIQEDQTNKEVASLLISAIDAALHIPDGTLAYVFNEFLKSATEENISALSERYTNRFVKKINENIKKTKVSDAIKLSDNAAKDAIHQLAVVVPLKEIEIAKGRLDLLDADANHESILDTKEEDLRNVSYLLTAAKRDIKAFGLADGSYNNAKYFNDMLSKIKNLQMKSDNLFSKLAEQRILRLKSEERLIDEAHEVLKRPHPIF